MRGPHPILRFKFLFRALLVVSAFITGRYGGPIIAVALMLILIAVAAVLSYYEYQETRVQPASDALTTILDERILPRFVNDYSQVYPSPPEVRVNVMLLRRRNWKVWNQSRRVWPWEKTMKIEATYGDYQSNREESLEWRTYEGLAGAGVNKRSNEVWSNLEETEQDLQSVWQLTDDQYSRTKHINSVLSVPIYLPSDSEKNNPAGVLNIDSESPLSETGFDQEDVREVAIYYANLIGAIVE